LLQRRQRIGEPQEDPVHNGGEGIRQELFAACEIVPDRPDRQAGLVCYLTEGGPLQAVNGNNPENSVDNFPAPDFGIYDFWHPSFLTQLCCKAGFCRGGSGPDRDRHPEWPGVADPKWDSVEA
jgi:hypothetical protein